MGTCASIFIKSKFLCYTHYDSEPFKLGEALSRAKTYWKEILKICKEYKIYAIAAKYWIKDPKFVYDCFAGQHQEEHPELLNLQLVEQFKAGNRNIIEENFEECLIDWSNEPHTRYFNITDDYQYNHYNDKVFIRLRFTNFPWLLIDELGHLYDDERILEDVLLDMLGVLEPSEVTEDLLRRVQMKGAIGSGRNFILACKKATELIPEDPNNWWNYGVSLERQGKLIQAIEQYSKAVELTPTNPSIWRILGSVYSKLGHTLETSNCIKNAISNLKNFDKTDKSFFKTHVEDEIKAIEDILLKIPNKEEIQNLLYDSLIPIYTDLKDWNKLAWASFKIGKIDDSIKSFKISINDIFKSDYVIYIENRLIAFKKYIDEIKFTEYLPICNFIIDQLKKKLLLYPQNVTLWRLIGENLFICGNEQQASEVFDTCIVNLKGLDDEALKNKEKNALIKFLPDPKYRYLITKLEKT